MRGLIIAEGAINHIKSVSALFSKYRVSWRASRQKKKNVHVRVTARGGAALRREQQRMPSVVMNARLVCIGDDGIRTLS
jgi:hypothetical protein